MSKTKENGLRVSLCQKYVRAVTGKPPGKGNSPVKMAYRLLQETDGPRRGTKSINQYLDDCSDLMKQTIGGVKPKVKKAEKPEFLESFAWRRVRMEAFVKYGPKCMCCGATPTTGAVMHVDHIKPRKTHPELALELDNLQILCHECNHGKGNWNTTDWRGK